ncbi:MULTISPECIES: NHLP-related RiPP peptide [Stenotrophomonas]|jgi:putative modified peptide|uniref:Modified peptide n=1 Tax=Stenotrophomonas rhizophila TaxID=216778 RepID=A0AAP5AMM6_9GAMM|nr:MULTISPECIES: NHLP-related RiPP peptide [Stenotrophomonas]MDQ1064297.1 putative modified peptide [Stenotrophomonas sp. SORGH_AS_0282]MDQ1110293.1 putative modified peptide [Stenotrophomonas rhizophila]MDQ1191070.1 putative modified peptide [Stenotrophomonas sp. SORGH_AS_0282]UQY87864.1 NHLP-related RiPP peptide [Stenotrophomonas rhizophila]
MNDVTSAKSKIAPEAAARLVGRLIDDPAFRELFQNDTRKALAEIGYDTDAQPDCCDVKQLASVEELRAVQAQLEKHLSTSYGAMTVIFCFEAGKVTDAIK